MHNSRDERPLRTSNDIYKDNYNYIQLLKHPLQDVFHSALISLRKGGRLFYQPAFNFLAI